jgi:hypothetical protein
VNFEVTDAIKIEAGKPVKAKEKKDEEDCFRIKKTSYFGKYKLHIWQVETSGFARKMFRSKMLEDRVVSLED